jgi:hypothetical protein
MIQFIGSKERGDNMYKKTCYIANPSFGKSKNDDFETVEKLTELMEVCDKNNCKNIVICGGMYDFSKKDINNIKFIREEIENVSSIIPSNLNININVLSGADEIYILKKYLINMNKELSHNRKDIEHLGFDRVVYNDTLLKCTYGRQNNLGYNEGEIITYKDHTYDPSIRLNNIIKDFDKDVVLIGGRNRFEEFVYNNKLVIALPSLVNPYKSNRSPDLGYVIIDKGKDGIDVKQHVKVLNKKPDFK